MYKLLLAASLALCASSAGAQNITCTNQVRGTSTNACANTRFVEDAVANPSTTLSVPNGGTGQTSFTAGLPLIGNGAGPIAQGTRTGNTTNFATGSGVYTSGDCLQVDASGNHVDSGGPCAGGTSTPHTQDFVSPGAFTPGTTTTLTLSSTPASGDLVWLTFDGVNQNKNTWSLTGAVVTFNAAIPLNTLVVEAKWFTTNVISGVNSLNGLTGVLTIAPGPSTNVTSSGGNTITIGNNVSTVSITDAAYGAQCNATILASGSNLTISAGSPNLLVTGGSFTSGDVGKSIAVPGAGTAAGFLSSTILSVTNATNIVLNNNAIVADTALAVTQAAPLVYGTDDTAAINAAIVATPSFGTLYINPITLPFPVRGCLIKQSGSTGRSLLVDHPINIRGGGNLSALITDPSMGATIINIHALVSGVSWKGIRWEGFTLGTDTNFTPMTRFGAHGIWFDATSAGAGGFQGINIGPNLALGESSGGFYSLVLDGVGSQGNRIENNFITGGIMLNATADSNMILNNRLLGVSTFGIHIDTPSAGNTIFQGNSVTLAAGVCILNGSETIVANNFFEEETASVQYPHNAFLDIGCSSGQSMSSTQVYGNIILNGSSASSTPIKIDANAGFTMLYGNEIATSNARAGVSNSNASTVCGPNQWITASPHVSGTSPVLWGPSC